MAQGLPITIDRKVLAADYKAGLSLRDLSAKYGYNANTLRRVLIKLGVTMRPGGVGLTTAMDEDYVRAEYLRGRTTVELAAELGVAPATVGRRIADILRPRGPVRKVRPKRIR